MEKLGSNNSVKLSDKDFLNKIPEKPGVYVIRYLEDDGRPKCFQRFNGIDEEGILYIGKSVKRTISNRVNDFWKQIHPEVYRAKSGYHSAGLTFIRYFHDNPDLNAVKLRIENLEAVWKIVDNENYAEKLETELIQDYVKKFQDKPPLNISIKRVW